MAAAPEGLARRGGVGGFDRRIVDAEGRRHLPRIGAPHHGEPLRGRKRGRSRPEAGRGLAWGGALDLAPGRGEFRASGR